MRHRLGLVVRHVHRGDPELALQCVDLGAHLHTQLRVQVGERLVHQEHLRVADDRAAHGDALALAAGKLLGLAVEVVEEADGAGGLLDSPARLLLRHLAQPGIPTGPSMPMTVPRSPGPSLHAHPAP